MYLAAIIIFVITYTGIIFTRLPKMNIDRPSAAFFGAVAMILFGVIGFDEAIRAIDFNTIALLLGMMIIISTLELDGFFSFIAAKALSNSTSPFRLLIILTLITGFASAFLVNDAVVLLFTPVIILICRSAGLNPVPFLVAEILSSNVGSVMTITGNPQNMLIGINSGVSYSRFLFKLFPISFLGLLMIIPIIRWIYPADFKNPVRWNRQFREQSFNNQSFQYDYKSMRTSVPIFLGVILLFFLGRPLGISIPMVALLGGALILLFGRIKPSKVIQQVDWVLLLFFASLFIVVHGIEKVGVMDALVSRVSLQENAAGLGGIHVISLILSQVISNVPYTIVMLPLMESANSETLWLALASASTLAGNATIIGAMANLIVIESAEKQGIRIRFFEFMKTGLIITVFTLLLSFLIFFIYLS